MDAARYRRACEVFEQVCDEPPERQAAQLGALCTGDDDLRRLVTQMLSADGEASPDLDTGAGDNLAGALARDLAQTGSMLVGDATELPEKIGEFRVLRQLGAGGMGVVFEAEQDHPRRRVAIKVIHSWLRTPAFRSRFDWEVEVLGRMLHPGIPQVYQAGLDGDRPYLVMERVEGEPLSRWIAARRPGLRQRVALVAAIADAVDHAHERGIIHCDLKPGNVLVTASGTPKVLDFGIAAPAHLAATDSHAPLGTPAYMSPEQIRGGSSFDARVDVFALGVVAHEALFGRLPFGRDSSSREEELAAIEAGPLTLPGRVDLLHRNLAAVCRKALAAGPEDRYQTARAFREDLERALAHRPVSARAPGPAYRLHCFLVRRRAALVVVAVAVAVALLLALGIDAVRRRLADRAHAEAEAAARQRLAATLVQVERRLDAGNGDGAEAAFRAFVDDPTNQWTPVLADGWFEYGRRLAAEERDQAAIDAFARAFVAAPAGEPRRRALLELARAFRRRRDWPALDAALRTLATDPAAELASRNLLAEQSAMARDLERAAALLESDRAPAATVLRVFAAARPTGLRPQSLHLLDIDRDGHNEVLVWSHIGHELTVHGADAGLPLRATLRFARDDPPPAAFWTVGGARPLLVVQHDGNSAGRGPVRLYELRPEHLEGVPLVADWEGSIGSLTAVHAVDLEGDGRQELYLGTGPYTRGLVRLELSADGTWVVTHPSPQTDAIASDLLAITSADTNRDGRTELWLGAAAWRAYDVRTLLPSGAGALRIDARRRLGVVTSLLPEETPGSAPAVLATVSVRYPSVVQFGAAFPYAGPPGLFRIRSRAGALEASNIVPFEEPEPEVRHEEWVIAAAGDFDGDECRDLAIEGMTTDGSTLLLARGLPDGDFDTVSLGGAVPLLAAQLDDDPEDELVVRLVDRDDEAWVLGAGEERLPEWKGARSAAAEPASGVPVGQRYRRAAELVGMGMTGLAAELLTASAAVEPDPQRAAEVNLWAASLELAGGRSEEAVKRLALAPAAQLASREALGERARLLARLHRWSEAVGAYEALAADGAAAPSLRAAAEAELGWLQPQLGVVPRMELHFDRPLERAWRIVEPLSVRRDQRRSSLVLDSFGGGHDLAVLPVRLVGPRVVLSGRLAIAAGELGAGLAVLLRSPTDPAVSRFGVSLSYSGGGGITERLLLCEPPGRTGLINEVRRVESNDSAEAIDFEIVFIPSLHRTDCILRDPGGGQSRDASVTTTYELPAGEWELALTAIGDAAFSAAIPVRARLERLVLEGAVVVDRPGPAAPLALANGNATEALRLYDQADPVARSAALLAAGRTDEAADVAAAAYVAGDPRVAPLLRQTDPALNAPLFARLGPAFFELYELTWRESLLDRQHPTAWHSLAGLPDDALTGETPAQRNLLLCRARVAWDAGQFGEATIELERVLQRFGTADVETLREAHLLRALIAAADGRHEDAEAEAARFVELSPSPEEARDRLAREPSLEGFNAARGGE